MKTILLIDDEPNILEAYGMMLSYKGYNVLKARNGSEGLKLILNNDVDLIISDINMPKKSGLILVKQIRRILKYQKTPVILLSAIGTKNNVCRGIELGVDAFLVKPCTKEMLYETVEKLLAGDSHKSACINLDDSGIKDLTHYKRVLAVYQNAKVTDYIHEYLSERFTDVYVEPDVKKIDEQIYKKEIDILIVEIGDTFDDYFKFLFERFEKNLYIEIPTIIISEKKEELTEIFNCMDHRVDMIISKPFEYRSLENAIKRLTSCAYLERRLSESLKVLQNKIQENKQKEKSLIIVNRNEIMDLKKHNSEIMNNVILQKSEKYQMMSVNSKVIRALSKKNGKIAKQFVQERRSLINAMSAIQAKIKACKKFELYNSEVRKQAL